MRRDELHPDETVNRILSPEHQEIRKEYLKNCVLSVPMIEGLQGWYSGGERARFLKMIWEGQNPATVIDSMTPIISDCLRRTTG